MSSDESDKICKDGVLNSDGVCNIIGKLHNMSTVDKEDIALSVCANCGKEGSSDNMNTCNKCTQVKYCNAVCKKKHRSKHKKECEEYVRLAAEKHNEELRIAAELHDEKLFKQPPPEDDDCPICFLRMPCIGTKYFYMACCGKAICSGCIHAVQSRVTKIEHDVCPFCRKQAPYSDEEMIKRYEIRVNMNDPIGILDFGCMYRNGECGLPQNHAKALELWHKAGELGCTRAYLTIGSAYDNGRGVDVDKKKAIHYYELAAMGGSADARFNLGLMEWKAGNKERALKHFMIAAKDGDSESMMFIKGMYKYGDATKDDYANALQSYQAYLDEVKSDQRDQAAAADE